MKSLILLLSFISTFTFCSKNVESQIMSELIGKWTWVESSGGIMGKTINPLTTGNQITIEFTSEKFIQYTNNSLELEMSYKIEKGSSIRSTEETFLIIYENGQKQSVTLEENRLILYDECHDCYQNEYVKE